MNTMPVFPLSAILAGVVTLLMIGITYQQMSYLSIYANFKQKVGTTIITLLTVYPGWDFAYDIGRSSIVANLTLVTIIFAIVVVLFEAIKDNAVTEKHYKKTDPVQSTPLRDVEVTGRSSITSNN